MAKNLMLMVFTQGLLAVLSYSLNIILTRFLPVQDYGQLRYVISATSILIVFSNPGLSSAVFKCVIEGYHSFVARAYRLTIKYSMWGVLILIILSLYHFFYKADPGTAWLMLAGAVVFPGLYLDRWIMVYLGKGEFRLARTYEVAGKLLSIVLAGLAAWLTANVLVVMICMFAVYLFYNPALSRKSIALLEPGKETPELDREYRSYARRMTLYTIMPNVSRHIDKILIAAFLDFNAVSVYYVATIVPVYFLTAIKSGVVVPMQEWVSLGRPEALKKFSRNQWIILGLSALAAAALYLAMPLVIGLFGASYRHSIYFARVLCLSVVVYPYTTLLFTMLKYLGEEHFSGRALNVYSISKTLLFLIAVPYLGLPGMVAGQVVLDYLWFFVAIYGLRRVAACPAPAEFGKQAGPGDSTRLPDTGLSSEDYTET